VKKAYLFALLALTIASSNAGAQAAMGAMRGEPPKNWWLLDEQADGWRGISIERAYRELLAGKQPRREVVVAIIDSGVEVDHEDLKDVLWTNRREVAGNGRDDDRNGYVDDVHGWDFLGNRDGRDITYDTYEAVRIYASLRGKYDGANPDTLSPAAKAEYALYRETKADTEKNRSEARDNLAQIQRIATLVDNAERILRAQVGGDSLTAERVAKISSVSAEVVQAQRLYMNILANGFTPQDVRNEVKSTQAALEFQYNPDYDPRTVVGDNPRDDAERGYGNAEVEGPDAAHGTHVAGIVAAVRGNGKGIDGVATGVRLMILRTVPDGDERDKDVANAIRYAADNGAHIINMSFGKAHSPGKALVDAAARYADSKGVLMVHAAGNSAADLAVEPSFPVRAYTGGGEPALWMEVGASSWKGLDSLPATFSNWGDREVDVFAPGVDIYSTIPDGDYGDNSGTSMAAPVVSGLAGLLMAYYPNLSAADVKRILLQSAREYRAQTVFLPGKEGATSPFGALSTTGGIVNAYTAIQMAERESRARN
jgi:subtilisin family serine protease